MSNWN